MRLKNVVGLAFAAIILMLCFLLSSCGNYEMFGTLEYSHVHYADMAGNSGCVDIEAWVEASAGVECRINEEDYVFFSEGTYVMVTSKECCYFCNNHNSK